MNESCVVIAKPEHQSTQIAHNAELLAELEAAAKFRYTDQDEEYMKVSFI